MLIGSDEIIMKTIPSLICMYDRWSRLSKHENKRQLTCRLLHHHAAKPTQRWLLEYDIVGVFSSISLLQWWSLSLYILLSCLTGRSQQCAFRLRARCRGIGWESKGACGNFFPETWKSRNFKDEKRTSKMKKVMGAFENFIHPILPDTRTGGSSWQVAPVAEPWERPLAVPQRVSTPEVSAYYSPCLSQGVRSGECEVGYYIHHFTSDRFKLMLLNQKNPVNSRNSPGIKLNWWTLKCCNMDLLQHIVEWRL